MGEFLMIVFYTVGIFLIGAGTFGYFSTQGLDEYQMMMNFFTAPIIGALFISGFSLLFYGAVLEYLGKISSFFKWDKR